MLAAIIFTAACSPTENLTTGTAAKEAELTISVNTQEHTRAMITDSVLPGGSELCIGIFNPDGSNYMGKNYGHLFYKAENGPGTQIWKPSGQVLLGESEGVLYAYYPYSMYSGGDIRHIFVEADSYTQVRKLRDHVSRLLHQYLSIRGRGRVRCFRVPGRADVKGGE